MKIIPAIGRAFIIEDSEDFSSYKKMGLSIPEEAMKGVGSTGKILLVTHERSGFFAWFRHYLLADRVQERWKVGERVIFDKFIAEDIYMRDEDGKEIKNLRCIPIDCILGHIK